MSEPKYGEIAYDWVQSNEKKRQAAEDYQVASDAFARVSAETMALEVRLHEAVKLGTDLPPARLFVVGYSYEKTGVLVSRYQGWTSVQLVNIEDA